MSPSITRSALRPQKQAPATCGARPAGCGAVPLSTGPHSATLPQTPENTVLFRSGLRPTGAWRPDQAQYRGALGLQGLTGPSTRLFWASRA